MDNIHRADLLEANKWQCGTPEKLTSYEGTPPAYKFTPIYDGNEILLLTPPMLLVNKSSMYGEFSFQFIPLGERAEYFRDDHIQFSRRCIPEMQSHEAVLLDQIKNMSATTKAIPKFLGGPVDQTTKVGSVVTTKGYIPQAMRSVVGDEGGIPSIRFRIPMTKDQKAQSDPQLSPNQKPVFLIEGDGGQLEALPNHEIEVGNVYCLTYKMSMIRVSKDWVSFKYQWLCGQVMYFGSGQINESFVDFNIANMLAQHIPSDFMTGSRPRFQIPGMTFEESGTMDNIY